MSELDDLAHAAARDVDAALGQVHDAYRAREMVSGRVHALVACTAGRSSPNAVTMSRVEKIADACAAVLDAGGEKPPTLRRDPRVPTAGASPEEVGA